MNERPPKKGQLMMDQILTGVLTLNKERVANVKEDQLADPTPCGEWKVKDLLNHIIAGSFMFGMLTTGQDFDRTQAPPDFVSKGGFADTYARSVDAQVAGWKAPGVGEKVLDLPFGTMPGNEAIRIALLEAVVHGWDLAKATGQDATIPDQLASPMLSGVKAIIPPGTRPQLPFGPEVTVPATASLGDQLVAYLGRNP